MPLPIGVQLDIIVYSILAGVLCGIIFDLYNIIRGVKIPKFIVVIQDILFWIFSATVVFIFLLYVNYAFLGFYVYIFMILTLIIYLKLVSPLILKIQRKIIKNVGLILRIILKNLLYAIKTIYYLICGKK